MASRSEDDLRRELEKYDQEYFSGTPSITDAEYDALLEVYERDYGPYSTERKSSGNTPLPCTMHSLRKIKLESELQAYLKKFPSDIYIIAAKLDGVAATYQPSKQRLYKKYSESEGVDASYLLPYIKGANSKHDILVRGELIISKKNFAKYTGAKTSRSLVAGWTNSKTLVTKKLADIDYVVYHIYSNAGRKTSEVFEELVDKDYTVPMHVIVEKNQVDFKFMTEALAYFRQNYEYEIDGLVIYADLPIAYPNDRAPEHVVAFKDYGNTCDTVVIDVEWKESSYGLLKPTVIFETVNIGGVDISRATGHNAAYINANKIGKGAIVRISHSGQVIPYILEVVKTASEVSQPNVEHAYNESKVEYIAIVQSDESKVECIAKFLSQIGVKGISSAILKKFYDAGFTTLEHFLSLDGIDKLSIKGVGDGIKTRLIHEVGRALPNTTIVDVLVGSCLFKGIGEDRMKMIEEACEGINIDISMEQIKKGLAKTGLKTLADVFIVNFPDFLKFVHSTPTLEAVLRQKDTSEDFTQFVPECDIQSEQKTIDLSGFITKYFSTDVKHIAFTGVRPTKEMTRILHQNNITCNKSLVKTTTLLVAKDPSKSTSKMEGAATRGLQIISYEEFSSYFD
jgi:DNA ligase (NAD+)